MSILQLLNEQNINYAWIFASKGQVHGMQTDVLYFLHNSCVYHHHTVLFHNKANICLLLSFLHGKWQRKALNHQPSHKAAPGALLAETDKR